MFVKFHSSTVAASADVSDVVLTSQRCFENATVSKFCEKNGTPYCTWLWWTASLRNLSIIDTCTKCK